MDKITIENASDLGQQLENLENGTIVEIPSGILSNWKTSIGVSENSNVFIGKNDEGEIKITAISEFTMGKPTTTTEIPIENLNNFQYGNYYRILTGDGSSNGITGTTGNTPGAGDFELENTEEKESETNTDTAATGGSGNLVGNAGDSLPNTFENDPNDEPTEKTGSEANTDTAVGGGFGDDNLVGNAGDSLPKKDVFKIQTLKEERLDNIPLSINQVALDNLGNIKVDLEDVKNLKSEVYGAATFFKEDVLKNLYEIIYSVDNLKPKTKEKLNERDMNKEEASKLFTDYKNIIIENLNDVVSKLIENIKNNESTNSANTGASEQASLSTFASSGSRGGSSSGGSSTTPSVENITPQTSINQDNLTKLTSAIVGTISFSEIVSMYTTIGSESSIKSTPEANYGLLGLINQNGKYYYKIIDKNTGQVYFVEMNDKMNITWDNIGERQTIEVVGDNAFVMKLPQEGDVLVRTADIGDVYFLNAEKMTFDGVDYYNMTDHMTGEVAYMPVSDALKGPTLVSNLGKTLEIDNISEVI